MAILPVSLLAQDTATAMLRSNGAGVMVNRTPARSANALLYEDLVETQRDAIARIEANGSTADINPETMIQFEGDTLVLDHGSLSVNTSRRLEGASGLRHRHTREEDGVDSLRRRRPRWKVTVSALKKDVNINSRSSNPKQAKQGTNSSVTVSEGQQKSREENCGAAYPRSASATPGAGRDYELPLGHRSRCVRSA